MALPTMQAPTNPLSSFAQILQSIGPTFLGSGTTQENQSNLDPVTQHILQSLLGGGQYSKGAAISDSTGVVQQLVTNALQQQMPEIFNADKSAGGYNATTTKMLSDDLASRISLQGNQAVQENIKNYAGIQDAAAQNLRNDQMARTSHTTPAVNPGALLENAALGLGANKLVHGAWDKLFGGAGAGADTAGTSAATDMMFGAPDAGAAGMFGGSGGAASTLSSFANASTPEQFANFLTSAPSAYDSFAASMAPADTSMAAFDSTGIGSPLATSGSPLAAPMNAAAPMASAPTAADPMASASNVSGTASAASDAANTAAILGDTSGFTSLSGAGAASAAAALGDTSGLTGAISGAGDMLSGIDLGGSTAAAGADAFAGTAATDTLASGVGADAMAAMPWVGAGLMAAQYAPQIGQTLGSIAQDVGNVASSIGSGIGDVASGIGDAVSSITSGCFITTAVCEYYHLTDDCELLNILRAYRDSWLRVHHPEDIETYYAEAPEIVESINKLPDAAKKTIYGLFMNTFLLPAVDYINTGYPDRAYIIYKHLFHLAKDLAETLPVKKVAGTIGTQSNGVNNHGSD